MKIKELLNLEREIALKRFELEKLQEEANLLESMIKINYLTENTETIDISNIRVINDSEGTHFVRRGKESYYIDKQVDIFNEKSYYEHFYELTEIKAAYPILKSFIDNKVPKIFLKKLYYEANGITSKDLEKVLEISKKQ